MATKNSDKKNESRESGREDESGREKSKKRSQGIFVTNMENNFHLSYNIAENVSILDVATAQKQFISDLNERDINEMKLKFFPNRWR